MFPSPFLAEAVESQTRELTWLSPWSPWFLFLIVVPSVVAYVVFVYRRERISLAGDTPERTSAARPEETAPTPVPSRPRVRAERLRRVLIFLRVLAVLVLLTLLAQPVLRTTKYKNVDSSILVLVDDSLSMEIKDKYSNRELVQKIADFFRSTPETVETTTRYDLVRRLFRDPGLKFLDKLRDKSRLVIFTFAGTPRRLRDLPRRDRAEAVAEAVDLPLQDKVRAEERVQQSRISDCILDAISAERAGRLGSPEGHIAGVVLLSDGQQTPGARPLEEVARKLGQRGIPIHAVGVGNPDEPKDIRIVGLEVNDIVLAGDQVPFNVTLAADGFEGERVSIELKLDGALAARDFVVLEGGGRRQSARLVYRPQRPGDFMVTVEVEHRPGELFTENNAMSKAIKVLDQKIRVLYAEGPPRWEYRYLAHALIRDPTMEAQVLLFSADPNFVQESSPGTPPLARFPQSREEIFSYHVIVLGDVDVAQKLTVEQLALLKEFVYEAGGGLIFLAGYNADPSKYLHTDLYALLPVEVPEGESPAANLRTSPVTTSFNVELTPVGREHELMRLNNEPEHNVKLWENKDGQAFDHLPGFYWFAEVGRAKKGAVVLARHPAKLHPIDQKGLAIFAFMNYGKGRTFFSAVDNTWRWRASGENQYFYRFWGQVIRFCATGRLLGKSPRFTITTDKSSYNLGANVSIDARVFDANMKPSTEKSLTVYHQARGVEGSQPEKLELELDPVQGQGSYRGGFMADRVGLHDLWIGTETERLAFRTFEVVVPQLERRDPRRNDALLKDAARLSGGGYYELHEVPTMVEKLEGESRSQQGEVDDEPLWDEWWVLVVFTGIIALEWILRKAANLL